MRDIRDPNDELWDSDEAWTNYDNLEEEYVEDEDFYDDCYGDDDY